MATAAVYFDEDDRGSGRDRHGCRLRPIPNEDLHLFTKSIDNRSVIRQTDDSARWSAVKFITSSLGVAVVVVGLLAPHAWGVLAGYRYERLKEERLRLVNESIQLEVEEAVLLSTENLEKLARDQKFETPAPERVIYLDGKSVLSADRR